MCAIIETGGKQYAVSPGDRIRVERLRGEVGAEISFDRVLLVGDGEEIRVGTPVVEGARVTGRIVEHGRGRKVIVYKYKRRKRYRRKAGHGQRYTELRIRSIELGGQAQPQEG